MKAELLRTRLKTAGLIVAVLLAATLTGLSLSDRIDSARVSRLTAILLN